MQVKLAELRMNPLRDFIVDPIDEATVATLKQSIDEHGFWGGVACRQLMDGTVEIACGHHRVRAALDAGVDLADVFVRKDVDNSEMVRLYAKENATQRANTSSTALAGSIASAIRFLAKMFLTGKADREFAVSFDVARMQRNLQSEDGMGENVINWFLRGIPGITEHVVKQQLANLKASGDYARILAEVEQEILADHVAELQRLTEKENAAEAKREAEEARQVRAEREQAQETQKDVKARAKRVSTKAAETPKTFDFEGVAKHLKNAHQLDVFRQAVTEPVVQQILAVEDQAAIAKSLVDLAKKGDAKRRKELTGVFISDNITKMIQDHYNLARAEAKKEREALDRQDELRRAESLQEHFIRSAYSLALNGKKIMDLVQKWPQDGPKFPWKEEMRSKFYEVKRIIDELAVPR